MGLQNRNKHWKWKKILVSGKATKAPQLVVSEALCTLYVNHYSNFSKPNGQKGQLHEKRNFEKIGRERNLEFWWHLVDNVAEKANGVFHLKPLVEPWNQVVAILWPEL